MNLLRWTTAFVVFTCALGSWAQDQRQQVPPGIIDAQRSRAKTSADMPPPLAPHRNISSEELNRDAAELSRLALQIQTEVGALQKGILNKDLAAQLKQLEKLSKKLRQEMQP